VSRLLAGSRPGTGPIQAKLTVGPANDRYEQEADSVAERVMSMLGPGGPQATSSKQQAVQRQEDEEEVQTKPLAASISPLVQREPAAEEEEVQTRSLIQRRGDEGFDAAPELAHHLAASRGGGQPLPDSVRAPMESSFGTDFGDVRLHTDTEAAQLNTELRAQAFTHGRDVYLGANAPQPASSEGQRLLAHELTHVVQQTGDGLSIQRQQISSAGLARVQCMSYSEAEDKAKKSQPLTRAELESALKDFLKNQITGQDYRSGFGETIGPGDIEALPAIWRTTDLKDKTDYGVTPEGITLPLETDVTNDMSDGTLKMTLRHEISHWIRSKGEKTAEESFIDAETFLKIREPTIRARNLALVEYHVRQGEEPVQKRLGNKLVKAVESQKLIESNRSFSIDAWIEEIKTDLKSLDLMYAKERRYPADRELGKQEDVLGAMGHEGMDDSHPPAPLRVQLMREYRDRKMSAQAALGGARGAPVKELRKQFGS